MTPAAFATSTSPLKQVEQGPSSALAAASLQNTGSTTALGQLSNNYSTFLTLLMKQLQNQDPSSPMDTNQFTTELVQFSGVEQQVNTNASLTKLIQLTQSGDLIQSSSMVGHSVVVGGSDMPVQNGVGKIRFSTASSASVGVTILDTSGKQVASALVNTSPGMNTWSWNAQDGNGRTMPDGIYRVVVRGTDAVGAAASIPFDVIGLATGVSKSANNLSLNIGDLSTDFTNVHAILN